ncbi:MAG: hypothetical protein AAB557_05655 [Patescibacteria group bacterium]
MGDGPANPEQKSTSGFKGFFKLRRSTEPGVKDAWVGEVNPIDPFIVKGAHDTGGTIVTGETKDDKGVAVFPAAKKSDKPLTKSSSG